MARQKTPDRQREKCPAGREMIRAAGRGQASAYLRLSGARPIAGAGSPGVELFPAGRSRLRGKKEAGPGAQGPGPAFLV